MEGDPRGAAAVGHAAGLADAEFGIRPCIDADEQAVAGGPGAINRVRAHVIDEGAVDAVGCAAERQLAQRGEVAAREEPVERAAGLIWHVDLAVLQAADEVIRRQVDDFDVIGGIEDSVRHRLTHADAGDAGDDIVQAFDVLDVERRENVDAGGEEFLDVEPAFGVAAARRVGVGEFVDQHEGGLAGEDGVEVHLGEGLAAMVDRARRDSL